MALRKHVMTYLNRDAVRLQWSGIQVGDTCDPCYLLEFADRSAQFSGTFAATISMAGSNDDANYDACTDLAGNVIAVTAAGIKGIAEFTHRLKPILTGGDGTTNITVTVVARRQRR
jgi:hypothetical protein